MAAPVLQNYADMRRLNLTKASAGGVPLTQFMVVSGTGITSWSITLASGTSGHWNLPTDGNSPTPTAAGDTANLGGGPYVFNVTATNADGTSNTAQLTITVPTSVTGYTVSIPSQIDTGLRSGIEGGLSIRSQLGGRVIEFAKGCEASFANGTSATFRSFNIHTGTFTVTSEDTSEPTTLSRLFCNGGCSRIIFEWIDFEYHIAAHGPDIGQPPDGSNSQNTAMISVVHNTTFGVCTDLTFQDINMGADAVSAPYTSQWMTGFEITGQTASPYTPATGMIVRRVNISRVKDGIRSSRITGATFSDLVIDSYCSNSLFNTGFANNTFENILCVRPRINRSDGADHQDFMQTGGSTPVANYDGYIFRNMYLITADGDGPAQGGFFNDVSYYLGAITAYRQNNQSVINLFYDGLTVQGMALEGGSGWDIERCTILRGQCENVGKPDALGNITPNNGLIPSMYGIPQVQSFGTATKNAVQAIGADFKVGNFPSITTTNAEMSQIVALPAGNVGFTSINEASRAAYYENFFQDPGRVIDYPNLTPAQILAEIREAYAPIQGGLLMNADGTYNGCFFPDGTNNDGTVYQATPPSLITSSSPLTTAGISEPIEVTFQLDAVANVACTITPAVAGVTGAFSPTTVIIGVGQGSGTTILTASTAGTASITCTNNRSLANPAALLVTVTSAVNPPTTFAQTSSSTTIPVGAPIEIVYVLDQAATADVVITPAVSGVTGIFSAATVTIPFGQTSGSVFFTPSTPGTATISATNDRSLVNPANLSITVAVVIAAQLIKLGIRPSL